MKNILITGSKGYIGSYLFSYLNHLKLSTQEYDLKDGNDLLDSAKLKEAIYKSDYIIHLAAVGDIYQVQKDPVNSIISSVAGTLNLIKEANNSKIKKIIFASTWEVYGKTRSKIIDEKNICMPDSTYSISKYTAELLLQSGYNKTPWLILRLGTVYGGKMRSTAVIPSFIDRAIRNLPIIIEGDGSQTRQFTHIEDICKAFYQSVKNTVVNQIFNITSTEIISINRLVKIIKEYYSVEIEYTNRRTNDVESYVVTSSKAQQILKWSPMCVFEKELRKILKPRNI